MIWNVALLQSVRRTVESVDTSHPTEDSRQIGDSAVCPTCKNKQSAEHINDINGSGTFENIKKPSNVIVNPYK